MDIQEWKRVGDTFSYKGHEIFYLKKGSGPPLLLLHGFPTSSWDWDKLWVPLTDKFYVIAFDFIGFGSSDKPREYNYSLIDQADIAAAIVASQGLSKVHVLAHDYGDTVAQELLARQNEGSLNFEIETTTQWWSFPRRS